MTGQIGHSQHTGSDPCDASPIYSPAFSPLLPEVTLSILALTLATLLPSTPLLSPLSCLQQ